MNIMKLVAALLCGLWMGAAMAVQVEGVDVAEELPAAEGQPALVLNGAGVRKKFVVKVYVGALYLPAKQQDAEAIIAAGARRMAMYVLRDELTAEQLISALNEGLAANHTPEEMKALDARVQEFNAVMQAVGNVKKGGVIAIDFVPGTGVRVAVNGEGKGTVAGEEFSRALIKVWLGKHPVDAGLKVKLLGG
jgi:hypothetical protein